MNRDEFLGNGEVQNFLDWLAPNGDDLANPGAVPEFSWTSRSMRGTGITPGENWLAESLPAARAQYYWRSRNPMDEEVVTSFAATADVLGQLRLQLVEALAAPGGDGLQEASYSVLQWGGVAQYRNVARPVRDAKAPVDRLRDYMNQTVELLNQDDLDEASIREFSTGLPQPFENSRMDSGTSKIFSLLVDWFVIYDTRVACALGGLLGVWWRRHCDMDGVPLPPALQLQMDRSSNHRGAKIRRRFPGLGLPSLYQSPNERLWSNVRASWLCQELARRFTDQGQEMSTRDVEAALFMIGYSAEWLDA